MVILPLDVTARLRSLQNPNNPEKRTTLQASNSEGLDQQQQHSDIQSMRNTASCYLILQGGDGEAAAALLRE